MANCGYQCTDLPDHEQVVCGEYLKGGISSIGILECDHTITNFTNAAQFTTAINSGDLTLIEPVVGDIPAASPVEGANPSGCGAATILDALDWTINVTDYNVTDGNMDFYNSLNRKRTYLIVYLCHDDKILVIEKPVSWIGIYINPANEREKQSYTLTGKWTDLDQPMLFDAPAGIFDQA